MEQNNFEKDVHRKLGGLKIPPSDSVWVNIEKRIGKKHKDRRVIFILFFLILFLLPGGYWLLNSTKYNQKKIQQISNVIKKEKDSKAINKEDSSFQKSEIILQNNAGNHELASVSSKKIKSSETNLENKTEKEKQQYQEKLSEEFTSNQRENYSKATNNEDSEIALNNAGNLIEKKPGIFLIENKNQSEILKKYIHKIEKDSFSNHLKTEKITEKIIPQKDSLTKKTFKNQHKNPWILGITFSGGASLIGSNILERNYPSNLTANYSSGGLPSGGIPSYYYNPSPIKNSTAFIVGIFIEKNISPKTKISLGISYKYFSLANKVGKKIDSVLAPSQYLATNNFNNSLNRSHTYRNNFHYLEVPVSIKIQLNKNKKIPLFWNAGVNISQLISSNALQFKSNPGVYYNDNSLFNKMQFGLSTGISATLFSKQKVPVTIGPYFYYSPSKLAGKGLYQDKHFSFIGIRTEILFHKK